MRRMLELVDTGELGDVVSVEATIAMLPPDDGDPRWSFELAGGALMDLGCYGLHALRSLAPWTGGEPEPDAARAGERAGAPGVDEWLDADLHFPSGATARSEEHTSELQSRQYLVCRLLLEKKKKAIFSIPLLPSHFLMLLIVSS